VDIPDAGVDVFELAAFSAARAHALHVYGHPFAFAAASHRSNSCDDATSSRRGFACFP